MTSASPQPPPVDGALLRDVAGSYASGVTVVTGLDGDGPVGMTVQAFHSLSLSPPMILLCAGRHSRTWARLMRSEHLCVNVLSAEQQDLAWRFGKPGPDKFREVRWQPDPVTGTPVLDGVLAWLAVRITTVVDGGDHHVILARVVGLEARPGTPLVFFKGDMHALAS
ncbi:flavin reductase family protein [Amycolatopsis viridis]|uniref:Flavin reductase (DIM6/NTAB) family NADH-FMN oxidoreductase RutF n=1 Tax=Amycolatopsis viridis TaxID=185678 RepID=A0ABX0SNB7_9PSEU|nr:flavin reductase family protein [Amycolatopsis viridis]NIH78467.1 flavin reductase (DIM6/NTAB) family NADH-FMN oxidoreductase RutF [Amycolatopsis viridis]